MLSVFAAAAEAKGVSHREVAGRWPDVSAETPSADVVVCNHVFYNVADIVPFISALSAHARRRVVVELTTRHPLSHLSPLFKLIHGIDRPTRPTAEDAAAVLRELGYEVGFETFQKASMWADADPAELVAFDRRILCVGPERDAEIAAHIEATDSSHKARELATLWWDTGH
jgi:hypothetical protein